MKLCVILLIVISFYLSFGNSQINLVQLVIDGSPTVMYNNGVYSSLFISTHTYLSCKENTLFTYQQSGQDLQNNKPYLINIYGVTAPTNISISTEYDTFKPTISSSLCVSDCSVQIQNFCPNPVGYFNYFDIIVITVSGLQTFTYNVLCNQEFGTSTFQIGEFLLVIISVFIIIITSIFPRAWALPIKGVQIRYRYIFAYNFAEALGGTILILAPQAAQIIGDVIIWFIGSSGMIICFNQLIFKLRIQKLGKNFVNIKSSGIRYTDAISFLIGIGILLSWFLLDKNWVLSNIISLSVIIATIKVLKITSLKKALVLYFNSVVIQITFMILIQVVKNSNYQDFLLNDFNNPLEMQIPTINPVYGLKCSWLPVSITIFPGILISYFRRFDKSRNTNIYIITASVLIFIGSMIWIIFSVFSPVFLPFQVIADPAMLGFIIIFANSRKQIKILWNGKFYDAEFRNQEQIEEQIQMGQMQTNKSVIKQNFLEGLIFDINNEDSQIYQMQQETDHKDNQKEEIQNSHNLPDKTEQKTAKNDEI